MLRKHVETRSSTSAQLPIVPQQFELFCLITMDNVAYLVSSSSQLKFVWAHVEFFYILASNVFNPSSGYPWTFYEIFSEKVQSEPWAPKQIHMYALIHISSQQFLSHAISWHLNHPSTLLASLLSFSTLPYFWCCMKLMQFWILPWIS
jgi:hypothetical protein